MSESTVRHGDGRLTRLWDWLNRPHDSLLLRFLANLALLAPVTFAAAFLAGLVYPVFGGQRMEGVFEDALGGAAWAAFVDFPLYVPGWALYLALLAVAVRRRPRSGRAVAVWLGAALGLCATVAIVLLGQQDLAVGVLVAVGLLLQGIGFGAVVQLPTRSITAWRALILIATPLALYLGLFAVFALAGALALID